MTDARRVAQLERDNVMLAAALDAATQRLTCLELASRDGQPAAASAGD
jgi:hypothetical protein